MIPLDVNRINSRSGYKVTHIDELTVDFKTDYCVEYRITFMDDYSIWESGAYQFVIINKNRKSSLHDEKLRRTLFSIIEEFFTENPSILLYICDTGDGKQAARNRLFVQWFSSYEGSGNLYFQDVDIESDGIINYAALIVERSNPNIESIVETFNNTVDILRTKPE